MILHSDQKGNDYIQELQCHCIQILHSDIYSDVYGVNLKASPTCLEIQCDIG